MKVIEVVIHQPDVQQREIINALLEQLNYEGFWVDGKDLKAYIEEDGYSEQELVNLLTRVGLNDSFEVRPLEEKNWNASWESNFEAVVIDNELSIRAPFHPPNKEVLREVVIEPQMSFGTGHHQTTFLMARYLIKLDLENKSVLDMGCGTGVLAILAAQQGAAPVHAIDIELNAVENTLHNLTLNDVKGVKVDEGNVENIPDIKFDYIFANINKNILLSDLPQFSKHLANKGKLLLSGFFNTDEEEIIHRASENSLYLLNVERKEHWSLVVVEKREI